MNRPEPVDSPLDRQQATEHWCGKCGRALSCVQCQHAGEHVKECCIFCPKSRRFWARNFRVLKGVDVRITDFTLRCPNCNLLTSVVNIGQNQYLRCTGCGLDIASLEEWIQL